MLKLSTGVILAMGNPLWAVASGAVRCMIAVIVAVIKVVHAVAWRVLRWFSGHTAEIFTVVRVFACTIAVATCVTAAALAIDDLISNYMTMRGAEMEATKEERMFSEALNAATEEAERLQIRHRVSRLAATSASGTPAWTVDGLSIIIDNDTGIAVVVLNGEEVYRHADSDEDPAIYRGMGEWEHLIDAVEAWVVETERNNKFGGIEED